MPISTLTMHFREVIPDDEFRKVTSKLTEIADLTTWSGVYIHAISAKDNCIGILMQLALEMGAYCRIHHDKPLFEGTLLYRDITWDWKNFDKRILDDLSDVAKDIEDTVSRGYLTFDAGILSRVYDQYPELKSLEIIKIDDSEMRIIRQRPYPSMVAINLWEYLVDSEKQNKIMLASNLSIPVAISISNRMKELIFEISREPRVLRSLNSRKVEELVAGLIEDKGFMVELTAKTRDGGRDIIAVKGKGELLKDEKYLIEVKHPAPDNPVSVGAVRELVGVGEVDPNTGLILVSTTRFTKDAVELAAREALRFRLSLRDYNDLMAWVEEYCMKRGNS